MDRRNLRGGHRVIMMARNAGMLNGVAWNRIDQRIRVAFPMIWEDSAWDVEDLRGYEAELLNKLAIEIAALTDVTLIDCGAHLGAFSSLMCSRAPSIRRVVAIEPNTDLHPVLQANLDALPLRTDLRPAAVANFAGTGRLESPPYDKFERARYLVQGKGPIPVITVDSLGIRGGSCVIKIDVEGGEEAVIEGAAETIAAAKHCVVTLEAHPSVALRTGRDPIEYLRKLRSIRPFDCTMAETGIQLGDDVRPIFHNLSPKAKGASVMLNMIAVARS